ncbi:MULTISPECIES: hypothetical protein [Methylobacterium]|uniref:hypothetical protein n=1 Tax=Methylobacterium TaxID=407 RepID=UPI0013EB4FE8|nr:hypothetical protein [Methylobacterium sp. DB0501]NGM36645.1 hypothetical protein [Methylobacterium sp. DB0501]
MADLIKLMHIPAPWEDHQSGRPLPNGFDSVKDAWNNNHDLFSHTFGGADRAIDALDISGPASDIDNGAASPHIKFNVYVDSFDDLQIAIETAHRPIHIFFAASGYLDWSRPLHIKDRQDVTIDFKLQDISIKYDNAPLIVISRCERLLIRGLSAPLLDDCRIAIDNSNDVALIGCALHDYSSRAVTILGTCNRILIDKCSFLGSSDAVIDATGEICKLAITRCNFHNSARDVQTGDASCIQIKGALSARGYETDPSALGLELDRDALLMRHPTHAYVVECNFTLESGSALRCARAAGIWFERNNVGGSSHEAVRIEQYVYGLIVSDNRLNLHPSSRPKALINIIDTAFYYIFRNNFDMHQGVGIKIEGSSGGGIVALNNFVYDAADRAEGIAIVVATPVDQSFLSQTFILNSIRGSSRVGFRFETPLPRLFLFDNHIFGTWEWSIESLAPQPMLTSLNNWSLCQSLNVPLSQRLIRTPPTVRRHDRDVPVQDERTATVASGTDAEAQPSGGISQA